MHPKPLNSQHQSQRSMRKLQPMSLRLWPTISPCYCHLHRPNLSTRQSLPLRSSRRLLRPLQPFRYHTRPASTRAALSTEASSLVTRLKNLLLGTSIALGLVFGYVYITDTRAGFHLLTPSTLKWWYDDAEEAHEAGNWLLGCLWKVGFHPRERGKDTGDLQVKVFGQTLACPIGTSAGIDKGAEIPDALLAIGASIVEVGGATPFPQDGNPKPRVFRLPSQNALINRYGLNSLGAEHMAMRLRQRVREYAYAHGIGLDEEAERVVLDGEAGVPPGSLTQGKLMAVQIAKNRFTPDDDIEAVKRDYVSCVESLARYADVLVVNVSSPNTPGLRGLQKVGPLTSILTGVVEAAKKTDRRTKPAVMVKVSPDEDSEEQVMGICAAVWESGVDGVIVGNTTKQRPDPFPEGYTLPQREAIALLEQGGYSGPQLFSRTVALTRRYRRLLDEGINHMPETSRKAPSPDTPPPAPVESKIDTESANHLAPALEATTARDVANLKPDTQEAEASSKSQPLIRLPGRNDPFATSEDTSSTLKDAPPAFSASTHINQIPSPPSPSSLPSSSDSASQTTPKPPVPAPSLKRKVIFASGGITNGAQALEVLEAGASVAQIYTALVYGGVGKITAMKGEMREEMRARREQT